MIITLSKSVEEKIAGLPQEEIEAALLQLAEKHGHNKEQALVESLQKGLDDLKEGKFTECNTDEELSTFFQNVRQEVLEENQGSENA